VNECENCRIVVSPTKGIEIEDTGNLYTEAGILIGIVAILYIGKKVVDKIFNNKK
tara:strand:+ start:3992 stop:4156 length:165 start_codon:yes stop_codon:yes gene_type:complete